MRLMLVNLPYKPIKHRDVYMKYIHRQYDVYYIHGMMINWTFFLA